MIEITGKGRGKERDIAIIICFQIKIQKEPKT